jgi:hypothetical protein
MRWTTTLTVALLAVGCASPAPESAEIARFPLDGLDGVLTRDAVELDLEVTSDGGGSLRIAADGPRVVRLFEVPDPDIEDARLIYRARLRSENLEGMAYLEMWCRFAGKGEFFSRGLHSPLSGTVDWTTHEIPFFLQVGENPDLVKLNLVVDGRGTVWVDDIVVSQGPLQ